MSDAGQTCPPHYRYRPSVFSGEPSDCAETVYVIGGLYGNVGAMHAILRMQENEARAGRRVSLVFNGDFNWFNVDSQGFRGINEAVLAHIAIQGNVEAEIGAPSDNGCGCNYPDYVDAVVVARSNAIMRKLQSIGVVSTALTMRYGIRNRRCYLYLRRRTRLCRSGTPIRSRTFGTP